MVEEMKIVADILKDITDGAITGVIAYLVFAYVKPITIYSIISVTVLKVAKLIFKKDQKVVKIEDL